MGYHGDSLLDLLGTDNTVPPTERMLHAVADAAGDVFTEAAADATPEKSGTTKASWRKLPATKTVSTQGDAYESGTTNPHWIARFLEYGVEPHTISPKTARALGLPEGPRGGADHPGIRPHFITAHAAVEVEARLDQITAAPLARRQSAIEGGASKSR